MPYLYRESDERRGSSALRRNKSRAINVQCRNNDIDLTIMHALENAVTNS